MRCIEEKDVREYVKNLNNELNKRNNKQALASWNAFVNMTEHNEEDEAAVDHENSMFLKVCIRFFI